MKFKQHKAGRLGWSEWVYPVKGYLFKCCDCGLVHELEFKTFLQDGNGKTYKVIPLPEKIRAMFRARRYEKKT